MLKVKPITNCPHTRKSVGIVNMQPALLAQLSAAVHDEDEWAIILTGERHSDGYVIDVTGYFIPPQTRSGASVQVGAVDVDHTTNIVGVIHCHPGNIGVYFSSTDVNTLNTRFPMSIVVGPQERTYLGFAYKGVGKVTLPCGSVGEISFKIQPTVGPVIAELSQVVHNADDLGDCSRVSSVQPDVYHIQDVSKCGLETAVSRVANAFGVDLTLFDQVKLIPRPVVTPKPFGTHFENHLKALIPSLDLNRDQKDYLDDAYYAKEESVFDYDEAWCEACKEYDPFNDWDCKCGRGEFCMECGVGHDAAIGCPREVRVMTLS